MMTPNFSVEPIDLPKMYALVIISFYAFGNLLNSARALFTKRFIWISAICFAFLVQMILVLVFSGSPFNQQFFGANGRNTGFITYSALILTLICGVLVSDGKYLKFNTYALVATGFVSIVYGLMQISGSDPIKWNNPNSSMIGFLGNPDFSSAFLGIFGAGLFGMIFSSKIFLKPVIRIIFIGVEIVNLYLILKSHATQGLLIYLVGLIGALGLYLWSNPKVRKEFRWIYVCLSSVVLIVGVLGAVKIGPLASHLYKISVRQRGFYWRAAREMLYSHPFFGVGLDSYGDWYFQKRSANAAFHSMQTASNAAHNVFLDVASGGGIILLLLYVLLLALVSRSAWRILKSRDLRNPYSISIILAWVAYQIQTIASINQIGLAVWGWLLGGAILGFDLNSARTNEQEITQEKRRKAGSTRGGSFALLGFLGLIVGLLLVQPALNADHSYRNALQSRNANQVISSVLSYPEDSHRTLDAASQLQRSGLTSQALKLAKHVIEINPRSYEGWYFIYQVTAPSSPEHLMSKKKVQELNPYDKSFQ